MTLKRGLALVTIIAIIGVAGCTTTAPSILSFTGLPATMNVGDTATLTATGSPGSTRGLWTWTFAASSGCGTFSGQNPVGPTNSTTVTVTFTAGSVGGSCTVTVTLTTAAGRSASASQTTTISAPLLLLPACTYPEATFITPAGTVNNQPIAGNPGDRAFAYVQIYDATSPFTDDPVLHLRSSGLASPSNCPAAGDLECDDDDGATYTSLGGTFIAWGANSVIAGHPLATASDVVSVNGFGGGAVGEAGNPYRLYRHVVPAANLVIPPSDPGNTPATAFPVPTSPTPWMIGESITAGDADWYKFDANAGEAIFVALDMTPDSPSGSHDDLPAWDAVLELRDGAGNLLKTVDGSATFGSPAPPAEAFAIRINTSGTYFIVVRHFSAAGTGPGYHLTACRTPTVLPAGAEEPLGGKPFTPKYPDDK
jgi:hypothetical protein